MSKKRKSKKTLFDATSIATKLSSAIRNDLTTGTRLYACSVAATSWSSIQAEKVLSKFSDPSNGEGKDDLQIEAYCKFLDVNQHIEKYNNEMLFSSLSRICKKDQNPNQRMLVKARAIVHEILGEFSFSDFIDECKNSTGTSIGVPFSDTSQEMKFTLPLSSTPAAQKLFEQILVCSPKLYAAILSLNDCTSRDLDYSTFYAFKSGSRSTTVDKTSTSRRMIAIEPTVNMFLQQGLMAYMYRLLKRFDLNVETLPYAHKQLAYVASLDGVKATIDMRSASDSVSYELVRYLVPPSWFVYLDVVRSPTMDLDNSLVELSMFSTMGNATTFPLETLIFYALAVAAVMPDTYTVHPEMDEKLAVSVFGDDCILPTDKAQIFIDLCEYVGFQVNRDKSFYEPGPGFRESCGGDYYRGYDMRPHYIRGPVSTSLSSLEPWLYTNLNGIYRKFIQNFGPTNYVYLDQTLKYAVSLFRRYGLTFKFVPHYFPDDAGFHFGIDIHRFNINCRVSPIYVNKHGTASFLYCNYEYRERKRVNKFLRYILWLQNNEAKSNRLASDGKASPDILERPIVFNFMDPLRQKPTHYKIRLRGRYVMARARSSMGFPNDLVKAGDRKSVV